jgi:hypothetical protein
VWARYQRTRTLSNFVSVERSHRDSRASISASRSAPPVPLIVDGTQRNLSSASIDAVGGEPLAGSGFETEEPDPDFTATELEGEV